MTAGCIVLTYNLKGVTDLKLSRQAYAGIFLGKVKKWNDPLIAKANPGVSLPDQPINVVVRADGSGTTFVFTKHLSAISPEFAKDPGVNTLPNWPVGTRSKGNEGVTASVMTTPGAIGYIEYGYAKSQNLPMAILENKSGNFVAPNTASAQAALATAQFPDNLIAWVPDPEDKDAYPIATYTWIICYKQYQDKGKFQLLQDLLTLLSNRRTEGVRGSRLHSFAAGGRGQGQSRDPKHHAGSQCYLGWHCPDGVFSCS